MVKKLLLIVLTASMAGQTFGFFGLFEDLDVRAARSVARQDAIERQARIDAARSAEAQRDFEALQGIIALIGMACYGTAWVVGSTAYTAAHWVVEPETTWHYFKQCDPCTVVGTIGTLGTIGAAAYYIGRQNGRRDRANG